MYDAKRNTLTSSYFYSYFYFSSLLLIHPTKSLLKLTTMSCGICNFVSSSLHDDNDHVIAFDLGSVDEVRHKAGECPSCRQIVDIYDKATVDKHPNNGLQFHLHRDESRLSMHVYRNGRVDFEWFKDLHSVGNQEQDFMKVDSPHIDVARLRTWLDICDESHHGRCHNLPGWQAVDPLKELLLIDVEQGCLVQRPGTTKYFALSYLWGYIPDILETKISNVEDLKQKGAFTSKSSIFPIPQTIRDSITLVRTLGERFLWVDRFCIVQDHPAKHAVISRMDAVYANAYCTIVAADGNDADHGLRGVGRPRAILQQAVDLPQCSLVTETDVGYESKYHTRGWTYQELNLSARQLVFANESVFWACQALFWKEQTCGVPADGMPDEFFELPFIKWPDLSAWELFCYNYNWRELSFQADTHVAFSGVERVIERSFPAGFLYGLPEFFFDLTLLWWPNEPVTRRVNPSADNGYCLPSWSWLGWHGRVNGTPGNPIQDYVRATDTQLQKKEDFRVQPLVEWTQVGPQAGQERMIRNHYHIFRTHGEKQSSIPAGWTRKTTGQNTYYTNQTAPDVFFRYPLPPAAELPPEDEQKTWPPYLRLRTHRAFFTMKPCRFENVPETMVLLADDNGRWAGILLLSVDGQNAPFGEPCELVAVSKGSAKQDCESGKPTTMLADLHWQDIPKTDGVYEFYNVLWVKWNDDHVVREGVGRVERSVWEQQKLDSIDTQLR